MNPEETAAVATGIGVSLATMVAALVKIARSSPPGNGNTVAKELAAMRATLVRVQEARVEDHAELFREVLEALREATAKQAELAAEVRALVKQLRAGCPVVDP